MRADVVEGDGVWLLSASPHAEDLIAVWVVEEVLILSSVWHEEGVEAVICEGIVAPLTDAVIAVHLRILHPAVRLVHGSIPDPVVELLVSEERWIKLHVCIHNL